MDETEPTPSIEEPDSDGVSPNLNQHKGRGRDSARRLQARGSQVRALVTLVGALP